MLVPIPVLFRVWVWVLNDICIERGFMFLWHCDLFTLPDTDSDTDPGTDIRPKMGTVMIGDLYSTM